MKYLKNTINQLDLIKIYRALQQKAEGYIFFKCMWSGNKDTLHDCQ